MTVVTRFAPSPTGFLHIGGARTALFNWLYARHHGGRFLLRIEDTDRVRSTDEAVEAIRVGLEWLKLDWDGEVFKQYTHRERHAAVAEKLLRAGLAYRCYCTPEELAEMREAARREGRPMRYDGRWRERDPGEAPPGVDPVIRLKAPLAGETVIEDLVQGRVRVANEQLDDMILRRADGTATYMLAVVVDDHDMAISHVIRGDDHLTNAFRQLQLFRALGWEAPRYAHIPLIHGPDGAKLSKRHGALAVSAYEEMGFLPEAMRNYLLRLGWSHGDDEIISTDEAIEWFGLEAVGRGAARFDLDKLTALNGHYLRQAPNERLVALIVPRLEKRLGRPLNIGERQRLERGMSGLKERAKTVLELTEKAEFYVANRPLRLSPEAKAILEVEVPAQAFSPGTIGFQTQRRIRDKECLAELAVRLQQLTEAKWEVEVEATIRQFAQENGLKLVDIAQPLRAAVTGSTSSPGIFEVLAVLGQKETVLRLCDALNLANRPRT